MLTVLIALALIPFALIGLVILLNVAYALRFAIPAALAALITLGWLIFFQATFWSGGAWIAGLIAVYFIYKTSEQISPTPATPRKTKSAVPSDTTLTLSFLFFFGIGITLIILGLSSARSDPDALVVVIIGGVIFAVTALAVPFAFQGAARQREAERETTEGRT
jgi:hypothetical protein